MDSVILAFAQMMPKSLPLDNLPDLLLPGKLMNRHFLHFVIRLLGLIFVHLHFVCQVAID